MARCIFHIDLDAFFVSVEQVLNPKLKGKPVIVGGDPERRGVVASSSWCSKGKEFCPAVVVEF
jgi:DNA polymerase-4